MHLLRTIQVLFLTALLSLASTAFADSVSSLFSRNGGDPIYGNPHGAVTVVEFFDYQCGHCVSMAPVMASVIKANPNVRFVFKELPIRGSVSQFAARAALAANQQGKYYQFNHALMSSTQPLDEENILKIAGRVGLNVAKLQKDMNSRGIYRTLNTNARLASDLQVSGTPAFFVGKTNANNLNEVQFFLGEMSQSELQTAINTAKS